MRVLGITVETVGPGRSIRYVLAQRLSLFFNDFVILLN